MRPPIVHSLVIAVLVGGVVTFVVCKSDALLGQSAVSCRPATVTLSPLRTGSPIVAARTGNLLVANQRSRSVSLVDLETGGVVHLKTGDGPHDAAISADGRWGVAPEFGPMSFDHVIQGKTLHVIDMAKRQVVRKIDTGEYRGLHDVVFRPGSSTRVLVTAQTARRVLEVDVETGTIIGTMDTRSDRSHMLAVTPNGNIVFTTNEDPGSISRLDVPTHAFVAAFPASEQVEGIAVAKDGKEIWAGEINEGAVTVRDGMTGEIRAKLMGFGAPVKLMATPDGRHVVIGDHRCESVVVADAETRRIVRVIKMPGMATVGDFSPDSRVAFVALAGDDVVVAVDIETGDLLARHATGNWPDGVAWGPKVR